MNVFATDRSVSVRCVLILFHSRHLVGHGHHVADLQFVNKPLKRTLTNSLTYKKKLNNTAFKPPFSPGLGPLLLKIRPPFGPSSKIKGSPFFCLWYTTI